MRKKIKFFVTIVAAGLFFLTSCNKDGFLKSLADFGNEEAVLILKSGYSSKVTTPLENPADFAYYTKGVIEYSKDGIVVATIDFGDGTRDVWATITKDGTSETFDLSAKKKDVKYTKVITRPLIKNEGCNYLTEGTIKYFEGKTWVATVDYGDGTCDEWATKTWKDGSKTFSLQK